MLTHAPSFVSVSSDTRKAAFEIHRAGTPGETILYLKGRFDAHTVKDAKSAFETAQAKLILDLRAVTFIDSSALAALVKLHRERTVTGSSLRIVNPSDPVRLVFEITKLNMVLPIVDAADATSESINALTRT